MESDKIEIILEKYFEGETTIAEENELKSYFSSPEVAQHLQQYRSMFGYFAVAKEQASQQEIQLVQPKRNYRAWLSIAASVVILLGIGTFTYINYNNTTASQDLGTYDNPEEAFRQTQKALALLSNQVNVGVESVQYIETYQDTKEKVFK